MSNSSREVTEKKKKKNVWEEAGEEFYQESYPCGSGHETRNGAVPKVTRSNIPLPSHTARKNSFGYHSRNARRPTLGRTATATTNTNAFTTYNATTRLPVHETNVASLPDFAEMTIPNERKRWLELHRIKSMPINMSAKKELKTQLTTIPMLKLKGVKRLRWNFQRLRDHLRIRWRHWGRSHLLWSNRLRDIEDHSGTFITSIFISIKSTVYFNLFLFLLLFTFIIVPNGIHDEVDVDSNVACLKNFTDPTGISEFYSNISPKDLAACCAQTYNQLLDEGRTQLEDTEWTLVLQALNVTTEGFGFPVYLTYGAYTSNKLRLRKIFESYDLPVAYLLFPILALIFSLLMLIAQIRAAIKEVALAREGEFYKFSNLIFAGWDHYTKNLTGSAFRKRILKQEMTVALETEHLKVASESPKQKWFKVAKRIVTNILVLVLLVGVGMVNFVVTGATLQENFLDQSNFTNGTETGPGPVQVSTRNPTNLLIEVLPAVSISLSNFFSLVILRHIGTIEGHSHETMKALLLTRALIGRLLNVGSVAANYYMTLYCSKARGSCTVCSDMSLGTKDPCWEAGFGGQILIIILVDLLFQLVLTLVFGYGRFLLGQLGSCKIFSDRNFRTIRHSLDVLYLQSLSSLFYFSPFLPLFILIYSVVIFYLKKASLVTLAKGVAETVRTTKSKAVYVTVRLIALTTVTLSLGLVLFEIEPSKGCGPFSTNGIPWDVVTDLDHPLATDTAGMILSPRILTPVLVVIVVVSYFYYSSAKANRRMVETLKHMLVLEGHDKQYLFARLNPVPEGTENGTLLDANNVGMETGNHVGSRN